MAMTLRLGTLSVHLLANTKQYTAALLRADRLLQKTSARMTAMGRKMSTRITLPLLLIGGASVKSFANFDDAMTQSLAIMGDVSKEMRREMEDVAKAISSKSITSARELAQSYYYLASAGLSAAQSVKALGAVEKFAVAGRFDMDRATTLAMDAQSAMGLRVADATKNMENTIRVTDVLVRANTLANASVEQFSTALTAKAAAAMKAYNIELEEGVAMLAAYAEQGIKAELAGNTFSRMLRLLIKSILKNEDVFRKLGIRTRDAKDDLVPLADIIEDMTRSLTGMGAVQKAATLSMLGFQARSQQAILPLLGMADKIRMYQRELEKAGGYTEHVANKQLKSFSSQLKIVWHNVVLVGMAIGKILAPAVTWIGKKVKDAAIWFQRLDDTTKKWIVGIAVAAATLGPLLMGLGFLIQLIHIAIVGITSLGLAGAGYILVAVLMATAIWAVADALTDANLGFLSLARGIRISGTKIGTWMDVLASYIVQAWEWAVNRVTIAWKAMKYTVTEILAKLSRTVLRIAKAIAKAWDYFTEAEVSDFYEDALDKSLSKSEGRWEDYYDAVSKLNREHMKKSKIWEKVRAGFFLADVEQPVVKKQERKLKELLKGIEEAKKMAVGGIDIPSPVSQLGTFRQVTRFQLAGGVGRQRMEVRSPEQRETNTRLERIEEILKQGLIPGMA